MTNLILKKSNLGKAVFANKNFKKNEKIIVFKGALMKKAELPELIKPEDDRYMQVSKNKYLGPSGNFDDFFNHSCNPNAGIKIIDKKVILMAIQNIKKKRGNNLGLFNNNG